MGVMVSRQGKKNSKTRYIHPWEYSLPVGVGIRLSQPHKVVMTESSIVTRTVCILQEQKSRNTWNLISTRRNWVNGIMRERMSGENILDRKPMCMSMRKMKG